MRLVHQNEVGLVLICFDCQDIHVGLGNLKAKVNLGGFQILEKSLLSLKNKPKSEYNSPTDQCYILNSPEENLFVVFTIKELFVVIELFQIISNLLGLEYLLKRN